jgi:predicted dinucleotide-binding enzyme
MKIGIVGAGNVGATLGRRFAAVGHEVAFGTRRPESPEMQELGKIAGARVTSNEEAARSSEVVVLATPWPATEAAVRGLGDLTGKILLDCTNPLKPDLSGLEVGTTSSGGEMVAGWAAGARVVKIFNTIGFNIMDNPAFPDRAATVFYCGDDAEAKGVARELAAGIGFEPVDAGPLRQSRTLEPLALLWISLAYVAGQGREIALQLIRR